MKTKINYIIKQFGQETIIMKSQNDEPIYTKAFIQPLRCDYQSELYKDYMETEGTEQFLYIGPPECPISTYPDTTIITSGQQSYIIKKAESVYLSNTQMYERAVLEKAPN